jgi:type IV pilus biogenesis protein CpaD/CtpE
VTDPRRAMAEALAKVSYPTFKASEVQRVADDLIDHLADAGVVLVSDADEGVRGWLDSRAHCLDRAAANAPRGSREQETATALAAELRRCATEVGHG